MEMHTKFLISFFIQLALLVLVAASFKAYTFSITPKKIGDLVGFKSYALSAAPQVVDDGEIAD